MACLGPCVRTGQPEHLRTFDYLGCYRYFLTFCTFERQKRFTGEDHVAVAHAQILRAAHDEGVAILAYCYMPDHVHLLCEGERDDADCRRFIKHAKQFSGFHYKNRFSRPLWQRYGYERTLRDDEQTLSVARYIMENPLRANLVRDIRKYPFVGSERYTVEQMLDAVAWVRPSG